jgi:hypothetical protein
VNSKTYLGPKSRPVWGVAKSLAPGETLDLTTGGAFYVPDESSASFPANATTYGVVKESN